MAKIALRVRDLQTGVERNVELDSVEAAHDWLVRRPPFVEALGVASEIDHDASRALKRVMRPLDAEEVRAQSALDAADDNARAKRAREEQAAQLAAGEAQRSAASQAEPSRPMQIRWTYDDGMTIGDPYDERSITDAARDAVLAWIAERNEWVIGRRQIVGQALVTVWPNAVPVDDERVLNGTFTPVTAPSAEEKPN